MAEDTAERREILYSGRVQGVGFRYTCRSIAAHYAVSGYVKNLPDGRVQLVAEGAPLQVQRLLDAIDDALGRYITQKQGDARPASGRFDGFEIRV